MKFDIRVIRKSLSAGLLGLALFPWACHKRPIATAPPPPPPPAPIPTVAPTPVPAPIPSTIPKLPSGPNYFDVGEQYFQLGDYGNAAQAYETYLRNDFSSDNQDAALFRLAMTHAFADSPVHDPAQAVSLLQQLVKQFPQSPLRPQAEFLLNLQEEIDRLRTDVNRRDDRIRELTKELERLKAIDMQRRPSR